MTHSPEHLFEKPTLLSAFFSVLLFWAISWALLGARQKIGALFWGLKRVRLVSRALFWVGLLARALFWGLFKGLSVHQNLNEILRWELFLCWKRRQLEFPPVRAPLGSYQLFHHNIELLEPLEKCLKFWSYVAEVTVFRKNSKFWAKVDVMCHRQKNSLTHKRIQNPKILLPRSNAG